MVYELPLRAINILERDPDLGLLLSLEAVGIADRLEALPLLDAQNATTKALVNYLVARLELALDMDILGVGENGTLEATFEEPEEEVNEN